MGLPADRHPHGDILSNDSKRPAFEAYVVDGDGKDAFWTKIGAAWPHDDNKGFNVQLTAMPLRAESRCAFPKSRRIGSRKSLRAATVRDVLSAAELTCALAHGSSELARAQTEP